MALDSWHNFDECLICDLKSLHLVNRSIVWDTEKEWHFATQKELNEDIEKIDERKFCRSCLQERSEY